jgi:site-specific recombinase XerD
MRLIDTYSEASEASLVPLAAAGFAELPAARSESPWERIRSLVVDSVSSAHSKRAYAGALAEFFNWYRQEQPGALSKAAVQHYKASVLEGRGLAPASINLHLAALRKLAAEAADNGLLDSEVARAIGRVKGAKNNGSRLGNWLSREQAQELLNTPDREELKGLRDVALLAVLLGAGLRRSEAVTLGVNHLQQREGRWVIVDLPGKAGRTRSVPIAAWVKAAIDRWLASGGITEGCVFRAVNRGGRMHGERMTAQAVYVVLKTYAEGLAPHDCRRTFAQLARKENASIEQIQLSLGHASVQTTERYLGTRLDLWDAPSDRIKLRA